MLKAKIKEFTDDDEKEPVGLVDGGHTILYCSNCGKGLVGIYHTQPDAIDPGTGKPFEWKMKAVCCYCGDQSYISEVKGKFCLWPYGKIKDDDESQDIQETSLDEIVYDDDLITIGTKKA